MAEDNLIVLGGPLFRKLGITRDEFMKGWQRHAEVVIPWFLEFGVIEYTQIHLPLTLISASIADDSAQQQPEGREPDIARAHETFRQADGVAFVKCLSLRSSSGVGRPFGDGFKHPYFSTVIAKDESTFLHLDSGASTAKGGADFPILPEIAGGAATWRRVALEGGGQERVKIKGAKQVVDNFWWDEWRNSVKV